MKAVGTGIALGMLLAGVVSLSFADDPKKDEKAFTTKASKSEPATHVDFNGALGLSFDSLATLGSQIEEARRGPDPLALANAATYLAAAEAAAGKKAPLTAEQLLKEAVALAKQRDRAAELKAVGFLVKDEPMSKELQTLAVAAEKVEAKEIEAFKTGEKSRGVWGYLTVRNNTGFKIQVYVNGTHYGWVNPYGDYRFTRPLRHGPNTNTVLKARTADGRNNWGPIFKDNPQGDETWVLDP